MPEQNQPPPQNQPAFFQPVVSFGFAMDAAVACSGTEGGTIGLGAARPMSHCGPESISHAFARSRKISTGNIVTWKLEKGGKKLAKVS